jgi:hypothetical protein
MATMSSYSIKHNIIKTYGGDEATVPIFLSLALHRDDLYTSAVSRQPDWQHRQSKHCRISLRFLSLLMILTTCGSSWSTTWPMQRSFSDFYLLTIITKNSMWYFIMIRPQFMCIHVGMYVCVCIIQHGTPALTAHFYNVHSFYPNKFTMHNTPLIIFLLLSHLIHYSK